MSIIVAVKKGDSTVVAADSMHSTGSRREHSDNLASGAKLRRIGRSCLGGVGWSVYDNIIDHYVSKLKRIPRLHNEAAVFDFVLKMWKAMRDKYQLVNDQPHRSEDRTPFADLDSEFVLVNSSGIFMISSDLSVTRYEKYVVIGSGEKYSYGCLHALYDTRRTAEEIARRSVEAAIYFEQTCGGPVEIVKFK